MKSRSNTCFILSVLLLFSSQAINAGPKGMQPRTNLGPTSSSLLFSATNTYVSMGAAPELGLSEFTLEAWFRMDDIGGSMGTGSHGVHLYPIISKGAGNSDPIEKRLDINYIVGIQTVADGPRVLVADFESTDTNPFRHGMNHTIYGVTEIQMGDWHHLAVTYDGFAWRLYLDGELEMWTVHRMTPQYESWHHFGVGTALDYKGVPNGHFEGAIDEVRVWNYARSQSSIRNSMNQEVVSDSGLLGRWGFNEGSGNVAEDSSGNQIHGTVVGTTWTEGAPFSINLSPESPSSICPVDDGTVKTSSAELSLDVSDQEQDELFVTFYGREKKIRENTYTIAVIPDTQHYVSNNFLFAEYFDATLQYIVDNRDELNIRYVAHVGDIVQDADYTSESAHAEMQYADNAISILDTLPDLPYGLTVGNHDEFPKMDPCCTELFNEHFPYTRYEGVAPWYGGHFGDNNDTHYILFDGGGTDYIAIHTEYRNPAPAEDILAWMDELLTLHPDRKAIVVLHETIMPGGAGHQARWDDQGEAVYDKLKHHPNFFMLLAGHRHGEGRRVDVYNGNPVYSLMHNFQIRPQSGASYFRLIELAPNDDEIIVTTYSPSLDEFETDPDSDFSVGVEVPGGPWTELATIPVPSDSTASFIWEGLTEGKTYEWKVGIRDSSSSIESEIYTFTYKTPDCLGDIQTNGQVDTSDLLSIIDQWGECNGQCQSDCSADLTGDGIVSVQDILTLMALWGPCP